MGYDLSDRLSELQSSGYGKSLEGKYDRITFIENHPVPIRLHACNIEHTFKNARTGAKEIKRVYPWYEGRRHYVPAAGKNRRGTFITCPRGLDDLSPVELCPVCADGENAQAFFAFSAIGLWLYHEYPTISAKGKQYTAVGMCLQTRTNRACPLCSKYGKPKKLGYRGHFVVGMDNARAFLEAEYKTKEHCQCGGLISVVSASCAHCNDILLSMSTTSRTPGELQKFFTSRQPCANCGRSTTPKRNLACSKCASPSPLGITDVDLVVTAYKKDPSKNYLLYRVDVARFGPLSDKYAAELREPLDLQSIYAPDTINRIYAALGKRRPVSISDDPDSVPADLDLDKVLGREVPKTDDLELPDIGGGDIPSGRLGGGELDAEFTQFAEQDDFTVDGLDDL